MRERFRPRHPGGEVTVVWTDEHSRAVAWGRLRRVRVRLLRQRFDSAGLPKGGRFPLVEGLIDGAAGRPGGLLVLEWIEETTGHWLAASAYGMDGRLLAPPSQRIDGPLFARSWSVPAGIAAGAAGGGIAVWQGLSPSGYHIFARRVDASGRPLGEPIVVDAGVKATPGRPPTNPAVAARTEAGPGT